MLTSLVLALVWILVVCLIGAVVKYLIEIAPFIPAEFKVWLVYLVYLIIGIAIIFELLGVVGYGHQLR